VPEREGARGGFPCGWLVLVREIFLSQRLQCEGKKWGLYWGGGGGSNHTNTPTHRKLILIIEKRFINLTDFIKN
jgi:hypothetical protein